jgi:predicted PurR-regulated permease PerM
LIIKLLIIGIVIVAGIVVIYPDEIIQFSKGSSLQENTEQEFSNLKNTSIDEIGNSIVENFQKVGNKIENTVNEIVDRT